MISDSELSRQAEENFKQYQEAWRENIRRDAAELAAWAREVEKELLPSYPRAVRDASGGVQFIGGGND